MELYNLYAGSGKTTYIKNELIPRILKENRTYIVIANNHDTLAEYGEKYNTKIVIPQTVDNFNPKATDIILDEYYKCQLCIVERLYELYGDGKKIYMFGDNRQCESINKDDDDDDEPWDFAQSFLKNFSFIADGKEWKNHRNEFTHEYYDNLINNKIDVLSEVKKYSLSDPNDAEYIIAYRHDTLKKYDSYKTDEYYCTNYKYENDCGDIVCSPIAKSLKNIKIHGGSRVILIDRQDDKCLISKNNETYEINTCTFDKFFKPNKLSTIHRIQGKNIKSYYWCSEDDNFIGGREAYVIVSRLKTQKKIKIFVKK